MKIESSSVQMSSSSTQVKSTSVSEKFVITTENPAETATANPNRPNQNNSAAILTLSPDAQAQSSDWQSQGRQPNPKEFARLKELGSPFSAEMPDKFQMKIMMIRQMVEGLTGKKLHVKDAAVTNKPASQPQQPPQLPQLPQLQQPAFVLRAPITFSLQRTETYYERQEMSFAAAGVVNTSDGRQIQFDLNVYASHEFMSSNSISVEGRRLADPLVINFDGALPEFTEDRYAFDLVIGDDLENIFMPTNGSGFLALDKDGNGKIDDGSELFGATSGDGFYELSAYDKDGNNWIDENDDIFSQLKVMFVDKKSGEMMLLSLKDSGVGAIYLGSSSTNYEIKDSANGMIGVVRKNGIFFNENGSVGTVHHIDLTY